MSFYEDHKLKIVAIIVSIVTFILYCFGLSKVTADYVALITFSASVAFSVFFCLIMQATNDDRTRRLLKELNIDLSIKKYNKLKDLKELSELGLIPQANYKYETDKIKNTIKVEVTVSTNEPKT